MADDSQWQHYAKRFLAHPLPLKAPETIPDVVVCIPVYAEPKLINTLESVLANHPRDLKVEVLLHFNMDHRMSEWEKEVHQSAWVRCQQWISDHESAAIRFIALSSGLNIRDQGGVGWARKKVMDTAALRLPPEGILLCLDADCLVASNWLEEVVRHFQSSPSCDAVSINVEHDLSMLATDHQAAIGQYELHLRYLRQALCWTGHPFAFHTIGSAMAVKRDAYLRHGGMNTRQAGEDFYFLQKFIEVGKLEEINTTTVYPSARTSSRVPFGTGRAMLQFESGMTTRMTTNPLSFECIRPIFRQLHWIRNRITEGDARCVEDMLAGEVSLPGAMWAFLREIDFNDHCRTIARQTVSGPSFEKRFFRFFNAFCMIRYLHYMRDHAWPDIPVVTAVAGFCGFTGISIPESGTWGDYLEIFRKLDRESHLRMQNGKSRI